VAHVADACRIIDDGRVKAGLIGDESRLRRSRTSVCWLSANYEGCAQWRGSSRRTTAFATGSVNAGSRTIALP
jgi:hypothetical protein